MPTEADTCRTYIVPKLHEAGWEDGFAASRKQRRIVAYLDRLQARVDALQHCGADAGTLRVDARCQCALRFAFKGSCCRVDLRIGLATRGLSRRKTRPVKRPVARREPHI
jgi:hypothetical protein